MTTSTVLANATIESEMPSQQLSDAVLGGIIGGAIAGLVLFLTIIIATVYCIQRRKRLKLESPDDSVDPFTYVRQVNHRDGSWTLPPGSTILFESPTLPVNHSFKADHHNRINAKNDQFVKPEMDLSQPEVNAGCQTEAEVVVEKRTQTRNCVGAEREPVSTTSETGLRIGSEPDVVTETGFGDDVEPETGTGFRDEVDVEEVDETGFRDRRSVKSLNESLSEDYCNRVIDEAFLEIDNIAFSDNQSADMEWV